MADTTGHAIPAGSCKVGVREIARAGLYTNAVREGALLLYAVTRGELHIACAGEDVALGPGDACVVAPGVAHEVRQTQLAAYVQVALGLKAAEDAAAVAGEALGSGALLGMGAKGASAKGASALPGFYAESERRLVGMIAQELAGGGTRHRMALQGMADDLLFDICQAVAGQNRSVLQVGEVVAYVTQNCATASLASVAEHFHCHPNTVSNVLRRSGRSFSDILLAARMRNALLLLRNDRMTVRGVAQSCGYESVSHFYEVFRRHYHMSPGEYRARLQERRALPPRHATTMAALPKRQAWEKPVHAFA